jgi:hypothetical protein
MDVLIDSGAFKHMVLSAIEVYNKETNGYIMGRMTTRKLNGRRKKVMLVKHSYVFQTDKRKPSEVMHGNVSALKRVMGSLRPMGIRVIGGFHSHSHPFDTTQMSKGDVEFISEEIDLLGKSGIRKIQRWLEIIVSVKKKEYVTSHKKGWSLDDLSRGIKCIIKTDKHTGYIVSIGAYWVSFEGKSKKEEVIIYVPLLLY